jgi:3-oxoacyl-[acyl-carrier-protein] synthase-3
MFNNQLELIATGIQTGEIQVTTEELAKKEWAKYYTDGTSMGPPQKTSAAEIVRRLGVVTRPITKTQNHVGMFNSAFDQALQDASQRGHTNVDGNIVALFAGTTKDPRDIPNFLHDICDHTRLHPNSYRELISQACSSFNNGVTRLSDYVEANPGIYGYAVVGTSEILQSLWRLNNFDSMMFGDVAGAAIFKITPTPNLPSEKRGVIGCVNVHTPDIENKIIRREDGLLYMDGESVMDFAPRAMIQTCKRSLQIAGLTPQDIDIFIFHPGSRHVYHYLKNKLDELVGRKLPREMVPHYLETHGNNGAATCINTLHQERTRGNIKPGMRVYMGAVAMGFYESGHVLQT